MTQPHPLEGRTGEAHPAWKTELDKDGVSRKLARIRGRAGDQVCAHCSTKARFWVLTNDGPGRRGEAPDLYSVDLEDYTAMCGRHRREHCPNLRHWRALGIRA